MLRVKTVLHFLPMVLGSCLGILAFSWPLYLPDSDFILLQPESARILSLLIAAIAISILSLEISRGAMDAKSVAILGVLAALIAALRLVGAGAIGVEPMWFLLILSSYVFGTRFGFSLGVLSMGVSALLTGGIGTWLPFQMMAAGWIGAISGLAGLIFKRKFETVKLVMVGALCSLLFGALMDLQLWPWLTATDTQLSFVAGVSVTENLSRFLLFHLATALAWDIPRAVTTGALILLTANPILNSLRRAKLRLNLTSHEMEQKAFV